MPLAGVLELIKLIITLFLIEEYLNESHKTCKEYVQVIFHTKMKIKKIRNYIFHNENEDYF